jgi:hypothetical protein
MSDPALKVPNYVLHAKAPGVYSGTGRLHPDQWVSAYLDTGLHWLDWLARWRWGQYQLTQALKQLAAESRRCEDRT